MANARALAAEPTVQSLTIICRKDGNNSFFWEDRVNSATIIYF
jgi:hypothetical protein